MKEIIVWLLFLMIGIYSSSKLTLIETIIIFTLLILIDNFLLLKKYYPDSKKFKYKNYTSLIKDVIKNFNYSRFIFILVFFIWGFASSYLINNHNNDKVNEVIGKSNTYEGMVLDVTEKTNNYRVKIYIRSLNENLEIYIDKDKYQTIFPGYHLKVKGVISNINPLKNLGAYDSKNYKKQDKIFYNFYGDVLEIKEGKIFLMTDLYKIKNKICEFYDKVLDKKYSEIVKAMIVGESSLLDEDTKNLYKNSGVFHILAISGMHVGIIAMAIKKILTKLPLCEKHKQIFLVSILFCYTLLTGASISTVRAFLMLSFSEISTMFNRNYNSNYGLCLAAMIILMYNPMNVFNLSFILSFGAIVSMKFKLNFKGILENQSSNISVFLLMTPIIIFNFYNIQGLSILANIFILPLTSLLVILCFLSLLFSVININVSLIFAKFIGFILFYYEEVLAYLSKLPFYNNITGKIPLMLIVLWYLIYFMIYKINKTDKYSIKNKRIKIFYKKILMLSIILFVLLISFKSTNVLITFIDVDHGDSTLIYDMKENISMIIDGGGSNDNDKDKGTYNVYPYLKYMGLTKIDLALVTHTDRDHIKGIIELIDLIDIKKIALPYGNVTCDYYETLLTKCNKENIKIVKLKENDEFNIGRVKCKVISPAIFTKDYDINFTGNNTSVVLETEYDNKKFLFTGDIEKEVEEILTNENLISENYFLMKIPHHGSNTSSTDAFVSKVNPKYGIIMGNKTNINNFNKKNVYKYKNTKIITTYKSGMISFELEG